MAGAAFDSLPSLESLESIDPLLIADLVAVLLGLAVMAGSLAAAALNRGAKAAWAAQIRRGAGTCLWAAAVVTAVASVAGFWLKAAAFADVPLFAAWSTGTAMLRDSHLGHACLGGLVAVSFVAGTARLVNRGDRLLGLVLPGIGLLGFAYSRSIVSHAGGQGGLGPAVFIDCAHPPLVSLWAGLVIVAALLVLHRPVPAASVDRLDAASFVSALSTTATWALAGIVLTGLFNILHAAGSIDRLIGTRYGTTLIIKLALVVGAACVAGSNRFRIMPGLLAAVRDTHHASTREQRRFVRVWRIEALILGAVLVAAAFSAARNCLADPKRSRQPQQARPSP